MEGRRRGGICGTDLHILKGDVATCQPGTVLGHEGVGVIDTVGAGVTSFKPGDKVLMNAFTNRISSQPIFLSRYCSLNCLLDFLNRRIF